MSKKTTYLLGILITILLGMWLQYLFCCSTNCCLSEIENQTSKPDTNSIKVTTAAEKSLDNFPFRFATNSISFSCQDNFSFLNSDATILLPISDSILIGIDKLKSNLKKDNIIEITAHYSDSESNNSIFPDIGLARAQAVKNYFISKGLDRKQLHVSSVKSANLPSSDTIYSSIEINWQNTNKTSKAMNQTDWAAIKSEINSNPIRLYFKTGKSKITLTSAQRQKMHQIITYANAVDQSKIIVVGHTDNVVGVNATNKEHAIRRANYVKEFFILNGLPNNMIIAKGKGAQDSIASNATEEGKAKNRRVEILIQ